MQPSREVQGAREKQQRVAPCVPAAAHQGRILQQVAFHGDWMSKVGWLLFFMFSCSAFYFLVLAWHSLQKSALSEEFAVMQALQMEWFVDSGSLFPCLLRPSLWGLGIQHCIWVGVGDKNTSSIVNTKLHLMWETKETIWGKMIFPRDEVR